jgi:hypothetical protein
MPGRRPKMTVTVDRTIQVLAANGEPAILLRPGSSKGEVVVEFDPFARVVLACIAGMGVHEEELYDAIVTVETYSDDDDDEE